MHSLNSLNPGTETRLQRVYKVRPHVTPLVDLLRIQALHQMFALSALALAILRPQHEILHGGTQEQKDNEICEHDAVAGVVLR